MSYGRHSDPFRSIPASFSSTAQTEAVVMPRVFERPPGLELGAVLVRRRDDCRPHRVRRVDSVEPELVGVFPDHAVDRAGIHPSAFVPAFVIVSQRPEQGSVDIGRVAGELRARGERQAAVHPPRYVSIAP